jgi:hypothetical protein
MREGLQPIAFAEQACVSQKVAEQSRILPEKLDEGLPYYRRRLRIGLFRELSLRGLFDDELIQFRR